MNNLDRENKELFKQYSKEREKWLSWFNDDPEHSISKQIYRMLWNDAIFRLTHELGKCSDIKKFTDKFIAHKADSSSLKNLADGQLGVTLDQITKCHRAILGVGNFIYGSLLGECELGGIPTEQYDLFEELDKPWITKEDFDGLGEFWHSHKETVEKMLEFKPY